MTAPLPDNFPALVARAAREFGPSEAISDGDVSYSFAEVADLIDTASGALVASGDAFLPLSGGAASFAARKESFNENIGRKRAELGSTNLRIQK